MTFNRAWEIDPGIPVPAKTLGAARATAEAMKTGDSVLCDTESKARQLANQIKAQGRKYTIRKMKGDGWRVWRTE